MEASLRDGPHNIEGVPDIVGTSIRKQYNFQLVTTESRLFCEQNFLTRTQEGKPLSVFFLAFRFTLAGKEIFCIEQHYRWTGGQLLHD